MNVSDGRSKKIIGAEMSRQKRIILPDTVYHIMTRGNERQSIFRDKQNAVCVYHNISVEVLTGKKWKWNTAKRVLIYLLVKDAGIRNPEIARRLNGLHSSGIGKIRDKIGLELGKTRNLKRKLNRLGVYIRKRGERMDDVCQLSTQGLSPLSIFL